jgi:hypothetical protein
LNLDPWASTNCRKKLLSSEERSFSTFIREKPSKGIWATARPYLFGHGRERGQRQIKKATRLGAIERFSTVSKSNKRNKLIFQELEIFLARIIHESLLAP